MSIQNIPILKKEQIEDKSNKMLLDFRKEIFLTPQHTPILEFVNHLQQNFDIIFQFNQSLGNSSNGKKILGQFRTNPYTIKIDTILTDDKRLKFVLAHELGHLVFHRNLKFSQEEYEIFTETEIDFNTGKKNLVTDRDWLEWQANYFASCFLMPQNSFENALLNVQSNLGIIKNSGIIYLDNQHNNINDFDRIKSEMSKIFMVNKTNIEYRLFDLNKINDQRNLKVKNVWQLINELKVC
ncbi:MAG: ImmA/IrrE family metallo-endopeptidase [Ignavibacteria bacterium]|nr:ImmA/IrrE family metallo-endopeptidase [Ignavibacteria bacterium]